MFRLPGTNPRRPSPTTCTRHTPTGWRSPAPKPAGVWAKPNHPSREAPSPGTHQARLGSSAAEHGAQIPKAPGQWCHNAEAKPRVGLCPQFMGPVGSRFRPPGRTLTAHDPLAVCQCGTGLRSTSPCVVVATHSMSLHRQAGHRLGLLPLEVVIF